MAGVVASPSGYDPIAHPGASRSAPRPGLRADTRAGLRRPRSTRSRSRAARPGPTITAPAARHEKYPYFTSWIQQQVVDKLGAGQAGARRAFQGGLSVQHDARRPSCRRPPRGDQPLAASGPAGPRAAMVALHNPLGRRAGDGRRRRLRDSRSTSRRRAAASPAPPSSRSCSPRRCAQDICRLRVGLAQEGLHAQGRLQRVRRSTTTRTPTRGSRRSPTRRRTRTTRSTRELGIKVGTERVARDGAAARGSGRRSPSNAANDARRPAARA